MNQNKPKMYIETTETTDLFQNEPKQTKNVYRNSRNKQICFEMNRNKP